MTLKNELWVVSSLCLLVEWRNRLAHPPDKREVVSSSLTLTTILWDISILVVRAAVNRLSQDRYLDVPPLDHYSLMPSQLGL